MTAPLRALLGGSAPPDDGRADVRWIVPTIVLGLAAAAGWRDGGFWPAAAEAVALLAAGLLIAALVTSPPDRHTVLVLSSLGALTLWWWIRSETSGTGTEFLPLGASMIAFAASFAAVRPLRGTQREFAALAMACLGALGALVGYAGLVWRWFPMAMPAQGLWRLSSTLTYADAAGLVFGVCLLLACGCRRAPALVRVAVCLNAAGLLATQSRGASLAFACACCFVPVARYRELAVPLGAGVGLGVVAIASSSQPHAVWWLGVVVFLAVLLALSARSGVADRWLQSRPRVAAGALLCGAATIVVLLHHEIGLRALAPSDQDRAAEWSSALHQWVSSPFVGVGSDTPLVLHAIDGSAARFAHNEYLQMGADGGLVGLGLLGLVAVSIGKAIRRVDPLSSCAVAALVCWSVGGFFDFDWHLPALGLLGGWCAGLAARERA